MIQSGKQVNFSRPITTGAQPNGSNREENSSSTHPNPSPLSVIDMTRLRQAIYKFLGMLVLYPNETRLAKIKIAAGELLEARPAWESLDFGPSLETLLVALVNLNDEAVEQLEQEHNHLIRVKPVAPPYESFYLDPQGQARGIIAGQLEGEYANAGLSLSPTLLDMPDHLAVELEFMSFLCANEAQARETDDEAANVQVRTRQRAFLNEHLVKWFPQFARRIMDAAPESLYSIIVAASYAFMRSELSYLGLRNG